MALPTFHLPGAIESTDCLLLTVSHLLYQTKLSVQDENAQEAYGPKYHGTLKGKVPKVTSKLFECCGK
jgi:hypothetical protein